jgi:hypothetical protein
MACLPISAVGYVCTWASMIRSFAIVFTHLSPLGPSKKDIFETPYVREVIDSSLFNNKTNPYVNAEFIPA